jgi:hypothetical protein
MQAAPYDRALALASQVRTMREHYLEVRCGCGARRVIALARMMEDQRVANATLAHVALRTACHGCYTGPTEVNLCATVHGTEPVPFGGSLGWSIPLVQRPSCGAYQQRQPKGNKNA